MKTLTKELELQEKITLSCWKEVTSLSLFSSLRMKNVITENENNYY